MDETVQEHLAIQESQWIFNVEHASLWGDAFEQMVRSTKCCLCKMIGQVNFTGNELLATIVEIEAVINSQPLTPSHLIVRQRLY